MNYARTMLALCLGLSATLPVGLSMAGASERDFPFDSELLLEARPMKGSKQIPSMDIGPRGQAEINLWCNTVTGQVVVVEDTVTILAGPTTARQCPPERMRGDQEMLSALMRVTSWRREGTVVEFAGAEVDRPLRFRLPTN